MSSLRTGQHEHFFKGFPAPPGVCGGSKCFCFECSHKTFITGKDISLLKNFNFQDSLKDSKL